MMYQVIAKACTSCLQTGIKYPDGDEAVGTIKIASFLQSSMYLLLQRAASDKKLNNRPRKRLGYLTPNEKFNLLLTN